MTMNQDAQQVAELLALQRGVRLSALSQHERGRIMAYAYRAVAETAKEPIAAAASATTASEDLKRYRDFIEWVARRAHTGRSFRRA